MAAPTISSPRSGSTNPSPHHGVNEAHKTHHGAVGAANNHSAMNEARSLTVNKGGHHHSATGPGTHCQRASGATGANAPSNVPMQAIKKRQRVQPQSIIRTRQQRKLDAEELNVSMAMNDDIPNPAPLPLGKP